MTKNDLVRKQLHFRPDTYARIKKLAALTRRNEWEIIDYLITDHVAFHLPLDGPDADLNRLNEMQLIGCMRDHEKSQRGKLS